MTKYETTTEETEILVLEARIDEAKWWEYNIIPAVRNAQVEHDVEKHIAELTAQLQALKQKARVS